MKKKEIAISVVIAIVLAVIMLFVTQSKDSSNTIIDTSKNKNLISQDITKATKEQDKKSDISVKESENADEPANINSEKETSKESQTGEIAVYISGEVKNPQVVRMKKGDRLVDAVEKCGGMTKDADTNAINLALLLKDEGHYIIPKTGQSSEITAQVDVNSPSSNKATGKNISEVSNSLVNINTADKTALMSLPSVGEKTAQKIIDYRESTGRFEKKEDLKNVSGIGDKKYSQLEELITVD